MMAKKKKRPKSDTAEVSKRVEEVLRIRLDGAQLHDIVQYASEKGWAISDRQVSTYIRRADVLLVKRQEKSRRRLLARHLAQREALFARAVNAADLRTALAIADSTAKLQGLFTDTRDLKELARLAASQGERIRELEKRLESAHNRQSATAEARAEARPAGDGHSGRAGGAAGGVPGGPGPADG
jgi:hypothetical protein